MRVRIEDEIYEGSPMEIMEELWDGSFDKEQFPHLEGYIRYMCSGFTRLTDVPCKHERDIHAQAKALLLQLGGIDALEVLEDE